MCVPHNATAQERIWVASGYKCFNKMRFVKPSKCACISVVRVCVVCTVLSGSSEVSSAVFVQIKLMFVCNVSIRLDSCTGSEVCPRVVKGVYF